MKLRNFTIRAIRLSILVLNFVLMNCSVLDNVQNDDIWAFGVAKNAVELYYLDIFHGV